MSMKALAAFLVTVGLILALPLQGKEAPAAPNYFDPSAINFTEQLPAPPGDDSDGTKKELDLMFEKQQARTHEEVVRARLETNFDVFAFANVMGSWFAAKNLPVTTAFFLKVSDDTHAVTEAVAIMWPRPRPYLQDIRIIPAVKLEKTNSYPSVPAVRAMIFALILAEIEPATKEAILLRGTQIGDDRVLGGMNFPSDVTAGRNLAQAIFLKLLASPAFQADLAKAKAEIAAVKTKP